MLIKFKPRMDGCTRYPVNLAILPTWGEASTSKLLQNNVIFKNKLRVLACLHEALFSEENFAFGFIPILKTLSMPKSKNTEEITFDSPEQFQDYIDKILKTILWKYHLRVQSNKSIANLTSTKMFSNISFVLNPACAFGITKSTIVNYIKGLTGDGKITPKHIIYLKIKKDITFPIVVSFGQCAFLSYHSLLHSIDYNINLAFADAINDHAIEQITNSGKSTSYLRKTLLHLFFHNFISWDSPKIINERAEIARADAQKSQEAISVSVGADPELEFFKSKKLTSGKIIPDFSKGAVEANSFLRDVNYNRGVGLDGCARIAEIRPAPHTDTTLVAKNVKKLIKILSHYVESSGQNIIPVSGGGFLYSCGGHIHLGHNLLKDIISNTSLIKKLMVMLDSFLYFPLKRNNPFATRAWNKHPEIEKEFAIRTPTPEMIPSRVLTESSEVVEKLIHKQGAITDVFSSYDLPSSVRSQTWGIEYRSLPSFICDYQLTRITLKIAQKITEKFLKALVSGNFITYNDPPLCEDYLAFITKEEYNTFMRYVTGDKKDTLADNIFRNWKVKSKFTTQGIIFTFIDPSGFARPSSIDIEINSIQHSTMYKQYADMMKQKIEELNMSFVISQHTIPVNTQLLTIINGQWLFTTNPRDLSFIKSVLSNYVHTMNSQLGIDGRLITNEHVVTFIPIITPSGTCGCVDCYEGFLRPLLDNNIFEKAFSQTLFAHKAIHKNSFKMNTINGTLYDIRDVSMFDVINLYSPPENVFRRMKLVKVFTQ